MSELFSPVFQQKDIDKATDIALRDMVAHITDGGQAIILVDGVLDFIQELNLAQHEQNMEPIFCVSISFLRTALMLGKPACRIDAYGQDWTLYNRPIATKYIQCKWFLPIWLNLVADFQEILDGQAIKKYCNPLQAEQTAQKCVGPLICMMASLLKYRLADIKGNKELRKLIKGAEFKIEFGEYWDWKLTLFGEYPEVDIFNTMGKRFPYRSFQSKLFESKSFSKYDLKGCTFQDCEFKNCKFSDCVLADCKFTNCRFSNVDMSMCLLAGAQFINSTLEHMTLQRITAAFYGISPEDCNDWYPPMLMSYTSLEQVVFISCFLSDCILEHCTTVHVSVKESETDRSDFAILCESQEENGNEV